MAAVPKQESTKFELPKSVEVGGVTIQIAQVDDMAERHGAHGSTHYDKALMLLDKALAGDMLPITYYHELVHNILNLLGKTELNSDEGFVDGFANLLWQAQKTAKY